MANRLLYGNCGVPTDVLRLADQLVPAGASRQSIQPGTSSQAARTDSYTQPSTFDMHRLFDELQAYDSVSLAGDFVLQPNTVPPPVSSAPIVRAPDVATTLTSSGTSAVKPIRDQGDHTHPTSRSTAPNGQPTLILRDSASAQRTRAALTLQRQHQETVERNLAQALGNNEHSSVTSRHARDYLDDFDRRNARIGNNENNSLAERWAADLDNSEFWRQLDREFEAQRTYLEAYESHSAASVSRSEQPSSNPDLTAQASSESKRSNAATSYNFAAQNSFLSELRSRMAQNASSANRNGAGRTSNEALIDGLYREALRRFHAGDIPNAVLCFEAVLQVAPTHVDAWQYLATSHSLNEDDKRCIRAALRALDLLDINFLPYTSKTGNSSVSSDSEHSPKILAILMQLAVAYTNENQHNAALAALCSWIQAHPRNRRYYAANSNVTNDMSNQRSRVFPGNAIGRVSSADLDWAADMFFNEAMATIDADPFEMDSDMLLSGAPTDSQLARLLDAFTRSVAADTENIDPDLYCGLGVLYSLNADFDRAIDQFRAALHQRPFDGLLWNRLGAALANGGRPEEAIQAYQKALQIIPGLIRSRYNLAVAHLNLGQYNLAVEHLVHALRDQRERARNDRGDDSLVGNMKSNSPFASDSIWSLLRMAIRLDNRPDLYELCESRDLDALNRQMNEPRPAATGVGTTSSSSATVAFQVHMDHDEEFV